MAYEHVDILIVGAGISGISAAYYLGKRCPKKTLAILEGRSSLGGTWDLFRYPGIRSDSDMYTLGFSFRPWEEEKAIADGATILNYIRDTADEFDITRHIRFNHYVKSANWSTADARWTVEFQHSDDKEATSLTCNFLYMCAGYYDYDTGYTPEFQGRERFTGQIIHPQFWDENLDYADKEVLVIGSGATAVTLVPAMADTAKHVTMLQRSPTYMASGASVDEFAQRLHNLFPTNIAHRLVRWKSVLRSMYEYILLRRYPEQGKEELLNMLREELNDDVDIDTHFSPDYNPWDQRFCLVPDSDLFKAINAGKVSIVTDHIDTFTENSIGLQSGNELTADIIITATGLNIKMMGGIQLAIDGESMNFGDTITYKGMMFSDIPNYASAVGYTNASWTLKAELIAEYVCRLIKHMDRHNYDQCTPRPNGVSLDSSPLINLDSGYINRALDKLPKQGRDMPWKAYQNYLRDIITFRFRRLEDGAMVFSRKPEPIEQEQTSHESNAIRA